MSYTELGTLVSTMIKKSRYEHCLRVRECASDLAFRFAPSLITDACYVGIFHDAFRYLDGEECLLICRQAGLNIEAEEEENPMLLHGAVAALRFGSIVGMCPESWFLAMRHHTLGSPEMGKLGAILYIADYIEPGRTHLTAADRSALLAPQTLEEIVLLILARERAYARQIGRKMAGVSIRLQEYLEKGGNFD
jgi:putative HD superfamily hydrolase of NAD metabolism